MDQYRKGQNKLHSCVSAHGQMGSVAIRTSVEDANNLDLS